jgi:3'-phosphoadenosine 5'-phosphosulfate (PAPS) 3'-phosphatase
MLRSDTHSDASGNDSCQSKQFVGEAAKSGHASAGKDALRSSEMHTGRGGLTAAQATQGILPSDSKLLAFFGAGIPVEQEHMCGSIAGLAQYVVSKIREDLLREAGKVEYQEKIGADGMLEGVTVADKACSQFLLNAVLPLFPKSWTEEHLPANPDDRIHTESFVVVDPIDGTEEFKRGLHGGYGNLFGFLESRDGKHVAVGGMIVIPRPTEQEFSYYAPDGSTQMLAGTELWRTRGPEGGIVYEVNGAEVALPRIRSKEEIVKSGELRIHVRGVCAYKYNLELAEGGHPGARRMEPIIWALGSKEQFEGLRNIDVQHDEEIVEYAYRLAESLGVKPVFVAGGGSACGFNELLTGRVDVVLNLPGERSKEWDMTPAGPLLESRRGHISQCNGESFAARGLNCRDLTLREGYVASIALSKGDIFNATAGLIELNERSKRRAL